MNCKDGLTYTLYYTREDTAPWISLCHKKWWFPVCRYSQGKTWPNTADFPVSQKIMIFCAQVSMAGTISADMLCAEAAGLNTLNVSKAIFIYVINHGQHGQQGQQGYLHVFYKSWSGKDSCQGDSGGPFTVDVEGEPSIKSLCHIHILTSTSISSTLQCRPTSPRWSGVLGLWMCRGRSITIIQMIWRWY